jgi:hypothetical protein
MKKPDMQAALRNAAAPASSTLPATTSLPIVEQRSTQPSSRPPSRVGKVAITAWLPPQFMSSFRLIQAKDNRPLQDLAAEAFNELFRKYNVPTVSIHDNM